MKAWESWSQQSDNVQAMVSSEGSAYWDYYYSQPPYGSPYWSVNMMASVDRASWSQEPVASFPGSRAWAGRKEPGTHCLRMLSFPRISGNLEISCKTCSVTLTSARTPTSPLLNAACH